MSMGFNKSEFRFSETFNNSDGKTSGSGFIGVIMGLTTVAAAVFVLVGWWVGKPDVLEIFDDVLQLGLLSAALLGIRKVSGVLGGEGKTKTLNTDNEGEPQKPTI